MFHHKEPLILLQTVKKFCEGVLFLAYNFLKNNTPRQIFIAFCNDIDGSSSQAIFNFVMHLDKIIKEITKQSDHTAYIERI